jgi:hypothetical protein
MLLLFIRIKFPFRLLPSISYQIHPSTEPTETLAAEMIESAVSYIKLRCLARPCCAYLIQDLLSVASWTASILPTNRNLCTSMPAASVPAYRLLMSINDARDCLGGLVQTKVSVIRRAESRLEAISWILGGSFENRERPRPFGGWEFGEMVGHAGFGMPFSPVGLDIQQKWDGGGMEHSFDTAGFSNGWGNRRIYEID